MAGVQGDYSKSPLTKATKSTAPRRRTRGQRGAVLVEAAIALPMVTLLLFGILEYGMLFGDGMKLAAALRSAARAGASMDVSTENSDYLILQSLRAASGRVSPNIFRVVIYKSTSPDGQVPDECKAGTAVQGVCNVYNQADLNMSAADLAATGDSNDWAPHSRIPGTDYLGVWAGANHYWVTGFFGNSRTVGDHAIMRVQPLPSSGVGADGDSWPMPIATVLPTTTTIYEPPDDPSGDDGDDDHGGSSGGSGSPGDSGPTTTTPRRAPAAPPPF